MRAGVNAARGSNERLLVDPAGKALSMRDFVKKRTGGARDRAARVTEYRPECATLAVGASVTQPARLVFLRLIGRALPRHDTL